MGCDERASKLSLYVFVRISEGLKYFFLLIYESFTKNKISLFLYAFPITFPHGCHSCFDFIVFCVD